MNVENTCKTTTEGTARERLATYFLSVPDWKEQTASQRREYMQRLEQLGTLEQQELLDGAGAPRPMVWANPALLIQAVCGAAQRLGATRGIALRIFPAAGVQLGRETAVHPRILTISLCALLRDLCRQTEGKPIWVRLQERRCGLSVAVTAPNCTLHPHTLALIKECTRLHEGSLVHSDDTIVFTCGQVDEPAAGVKLYTPPEEQELLNDSLSPVWSVFYTAVYSSPPMKSESTISKSPASTVPGAGDASSKST